MSATANLARRSPGRLGAGLVALLGVGVLLPSPASADPVPASSSSAAGAAPIAPASPPPPPLSEALTGNARQDYEAAKVLFDRRDFPGALVKFRSAFEAAGDPRLLWNAAVCEQSLHHYAKAIALLRRYVSYAGSGSPLVSEESLGQARGYLTGAEPLTAPLTVHVSEPDAVVALDDEPLGKTPLPPDLRVDVGAHRIVVTKDGFVEVSTALSVAPPAPAVVDVVLYPVPRHEGRLIVHAGSGETIAVDGSGVGSQSWAGTVPSGSHTVQVTAPQFRPYAADVLVSDGDSRTVEVTLQPLPRSGGVPAWIWIAGAAAITAGAVTAGVLVSNSSSGGAPGATTRGSIATVPLP